VRAEEVVVSGEQSKGYSAILSFETAGGTDMVFVGAIEAFDELLERAKFPRHRVTILHADHLVLARALVEGGVGALFPAVEGTVPVGKSVVSLDLTMAAPAATSDHRLCSAVGWLGHHR
jgi:hypothetical protein